MSKKTNYSTSKVYQILNVKTDDVFVGSTTQPLYKRFAQHKLQHTTGKKKQIIIIN